MAKKENRMMRRRLANAWLSTVISISLVLLLVGVASLLLLNARSVSDYFKENLKVTVLLKQDVSDAAAESFRPQLEALPFVRGAAYVSREQGAAEMAAMLGEDFLSVFETSPVPASYDLTLDAAYVSADSLAKVSACIMAFPPVEEVSYQQSLVDSLNDNLGRVAMWLAVLIAVLLFISFVLIHNMVRLNVFARRFTIHTMKLVGATRAFIRAPFMGQAVLQGLASAALATVIMCAGLWFAKREFAQLFEIFRPEILAATVAVIVVSGVLICVVSTYFVVNRLVSLGKDELYY